MGSHDHEIEPVTRLWIWTGDHSFADDPKIDLGALEGWCAPKILPGASTWR